MAEEVTKELNKLTEEQKAEIKDSIKKSQEYAQRTADYTEAEVIAEMMNPETEGYTEEELKEAEKMMADPKYGMDEVSIEDEVKKGLWHSIKGFIKKLFR